MYDILLTPVVTLPVIAFLVIVIGAQAYIDARRTHQRLREQAMKLGKRTGALLMAAMAMQDATHKRNTDRQVGAAIEATFDILKDVGFDKLASGEVQFEGIMFGDSPFKPESARRDPLGGSPFSRSFDPNELLEALRREPRFSDVKPGAEPHSFETADAKSTGAQEGGAPVHEDALDREGNGGHKGPRPYHGRPDFNSRSPRAG